MDITGVVFQLSTLLFKVGRRIHVAIEQHRGLSAELEKCHEEVEATLGIIDLVKSEQALQKAPSLQATLERLHTLAEMLDTHIIAMGKKRGTVKGVTHQLTHGTVEQKELTKITELIARGKQNLQGQVQLVHVGLTREARDAIAINTKTVQRIDSAIQRLLGPGHCLAIAALVQAKLKEQRPNDGVLKLPMAEFEAWARQLQTDTIELEQTNMQQRITINCFAGEDALQLNAPVEEDLWRDMSIVKIDGCVASGRAIQSNYIQDRQTFRDLLAARKASIAMQQ